MILIEGFLYYIGGVISVVILFFWWNRNVKVDTIPVPLVKFYLNVVVHNKKEMISSIVKGKFSSNVVGHIAGRIANSVMTDEGFSELVCERLLQNVPEKLNDVGIQAKLDVVFIWDTSFVVELSILDACIKSILQAKVGQSKADAVDYLLNFGSVSNRSLLHKAATRGIVEVIAHKLKVTLPSQMQTKMKEKGLIVDIICCDEAEQCHYLVNTLKLYDIGQPKRSK